MSVKKNKKMKHVKFIFAIAFLVSIVATGQEKKIQFSKGTLKICSSKNFQIEGYDGKEVVIKGNHNNRMSAYDINGVKGYLYSTQTDKNPKKSKPKFPTQKSSVVVSGKAKNVFFATLDTKRKEGLKRLGKEHENKELGIYFTIEQKNGELIFKDNTSGQFIMMTNESYTIKIPNSLKLNWSTSSCNRRPSRSVLYNSKASSLTNFNGEVEISTSLNNLELTDVTGPVSINSIGGNVIVKFDKKTPKKLYSVYSNNGFIDITLPKNSDVNIDANGAAIYSNIDFKNLHDETHENQHRMDLKLKNGRVKMKLDAGYGTIYLRKKE